MVRFTDKFVLSFNAANMTGDPMDLHCTIHQSQLNGLLCDTPSQVHHWTIGGSGSKRVTLELRKFILPDEKGTSDQSEVEKYSNYLADLVRLTWKCVSLLFRFLYSQLL